MISPSHPSKGKNRPVKYSLFKNQSAQQNDQPIVQDQNIPHYLKHSYNYDVHTPLSKNRTSISRSNSKTKMEYLRQLFSLQNSNIQTPSRLKQFQNKVNPFEKIDLVKNSEHKIKTRNGSFLGTMNRSSQIQLDVINRYRQSNILNNKSSINAPTNTTILNIQDLRRQKVTKKQETLKQTDKVHRIVNKSEQSEQSLQSLQKLVQLETMIKKLGLSLQKNKKLIKDGLNSLHRIYFKQQSKSQKRTQQKIIKRRVHNVSSVLREGIQHISKHKISRSLFQRNINQNCNTKSRGPMVKYSKKDFLFQKVK